MESESRPPVNVDKLCGSKHDPEAVKEVTISILKKQVAELQQRNHDLEVLANTPAAISGPITPTSLRADLAHLATLLHLAAIIRPGLRALADFLAALSASDKAVAVLAAILSSDRLPELLAWLQELLRDAPTGDHALNALMGVPR